jgi:Ni/Co efflux regulator RcnB
MMASQGEIPMRKLMAAAAAMALASSGMTATSPGAAIMPVSPAQPSGTTKRVDKKKRQRREQHANAIASKKRYGGKKVCKLGRRLRRRFELGRNGTF